MGAAAVAAAAVVVSTGYQIYSGRQAQKQQDKAISEAKAQPTPVPTPPPTPTDPNPVLTDATKLRRLAAMRYGFASTLTQKPSLSSNALPGAQPLKGTLGS